jgi:hypothetical protein
MAARAFQFMSAEVLSVSRLKMGCQESANNGDDRSAEFLQFAKAFHQKSQGKK